MSDKTVPLQDFVDEHNRLLDQLEAKERERDYYKIKSSQLKEWNEMAQKVMDAAVSQNKRLREALEEIRNLKKSYVLKNGDHVSFQDIAQQALKGGE
jgi:hypothetical protein